MKLYQRVYSTVTTDMTIDVTPELLNAINTDILAECTSVDVIPTITEGIVRKAVEHSTEGNIILDHRSGNFSIGLYAYVRDWLEEYIMYNGDSNFIDERINFSDPVGTISEDAKN